MKQHGDQASFFEHFLGDVSSIYYLLGKKLNYGCVMEQVWPILQRSLLGACRRRHRSSWQNHLLCHQIGVLLVWACGRQGENDRKKVERDMVERELVFHSAVKRPLQLGGLNSSALALDFT